jgi:hypothetical protein
MFLFFLFVIDLFFICALFVSYFSSARDFLTLNFRGFIFET